ncbi:MAG: SH3 domain-containing protein [Clostridia bacterium]|nr:SH3 domain-containing protein [Clostridia bacterium]
MKRFLLLIVLLLPLLSGAKAEVSISVSPEAVRMGDYVDVSVSSTREGAQGLIYSLSVGEETIFKSEKAVDHWTGSFRPRVEGDHTLTVTVVYGKKDTESASVVVPVVGAAPVQAGPEVVYQQKDGWWKSKKYAIRSVQKAGCALFTLSHALQRLGYTGEDLLPDALAQTYKGFYIEGRGTANESFLRKAGEVYGFMTTQELDESAASIASCLRRGDYFSFSIVNGHIALADGLSEDGKMVHIVDSAAGATYERMKGCSPWYQAEDGTFAAAEKPEDLPGLRWYFETEEYGGSEYWLPLEYCAKRGMRLIRPYWLKLAAEGGAAGVSVDYFGALVSKVILKDEAVRVPTASLQWTCVGSDQPLVALVTRSGDAQFSNADGKAIPGSSKIRYGTMVPVLEVQEDRVYVAWKDTFGYLSRESTQLLPVGTGFQTGMIAVNGKTTVAATVRIRREPKAKSKIMTEWKAGTPVALVREEGDFMLVEGKGLRGWVEKKYLVPDEEGETDHGQKVDQGE